MKNKYLDKIEKVLGIIQETIKLNHPIGGIINIPDYKFIKEDLDLNDVNSILLGLLRQKKIKNYEHFYGWIAPSGGINIISSVAPSNDNDYGIYEIQIGEKGMKYFIQNLIPEIHYNFKTGIGFVDGKRFKFKDDQPEYILFDRLYKQIGKRLLKKEVLKILKVDTEKPFLKEPEWIGRKRKDTEITHTYIINELVKKMRKRTGLNPNELVNNNGNLTLVGKKMKIPPKQS